MEKKDPNPRPNDEEQNHFYDENSSTDSYTDESYTESDSEQEHVVFDGKDYPNSEMTSQSSSRKSSIKSAHPSKLGSRKLSQFSNDPTPNEPEIEEECEYCQISSPNELAQCLDCGDWFCNARVGNSASHLVFHLVKRKHKRAKLHRLSRLGNLTFECFFCQNKNIFLLGLAPYEVNEQKTFLTCCRKLFCSSKGTKSQFNVDLDKWRPLIIEKQILDFLLPISEDTISHNKKMGLTIKGLSRKEKENMGVLEVTPSGHTHLPDNSKFGGIRRLPLTWPDVETYAGAFISLIEKEMEEDRRMKESVFFQGLTIDWTKAVNKKKKILISCKLPIYEEVDINSFSNQEVVISLPMSEYSGAQQSSRQMTQEEFRDQFPELGGNVIMKKAKSKKKKRFTKQTPKPPVEFEEGDFWKATGLVLKPISFDEILIEIPKKNIPKQVQEGFELRLSWKSVTHDRLMDGLCLFSDLNKRSISKCITENLLGRICHSKTIEQRTIQMELIETIPGLPKLNASQLEAIQKVLKRDLSILQGPPGTGKTITCASLVYYLIHENQKDYYADKRKKKQKRFGTAGKSNKRHKNGKKVLVCAPSNVVVDHLLNVITHLKTGKTGVNVVQVCSKVRENLFELTTSDQPNLTLHHKIKQEIASGKHKRLSQLKSKKEQESLSNKEMKIYFRELRKVEKKIIQHADVICCTCSTSFDYRLSRTKFDYLLVDEATQATEPEILLPMLKGARQVILIGDHMQLGPVVLNREAAQGGLNRSLFERLVKLGLRPVRLEVQYRMHPALSEFPSESYYDGKLTNGVAQNDRDFLDIINYSDAPKAISFDWPAKRSPLFFWHVIGQEELSGSGTSYINSTEADMILALVQHLLQQNVNLTSIGVITPYKGQRIFLQNYLASKLNLNLLEMTKLEVNSIDSFQGREKDFIILSTVRSSKYGGIGFLNDERRLNVALTRAKFGMVVIGNALVLKQNMYWNNLLFHFSEKSLVFEGLSIDSLSESELQFEKKLAFNAEMDFSKKY